jgi:hypothetical protein
MKPVHPEIEMQISEQWAKCLPRVYRLYREEGLAMRVRLRRRIRWNGAAANPAAMRPNEGWSIDFVSDCVSNGKVIRILTTPAAPRNFESWSAVNGRAPRRRVVLRGERDSWRSSRTHRNIAMVAMGRRLAIRLYWMWWNGCEYSPSMEFGSYVGELATGHGVN